MDVATGAMGSLLPKMKELCLEEHMLPDRVKQEVADLCAEIEIMQAALLKIAGFGVYQFDPQTKIWAAEAKEVSYLIDDVVDSFQQGSKPANLDNFKGGMTKKVAYIRGLANRFKKSKARIEFAVALQDICVKVRKIKERFERYKVYEVVANLPPATIDPRQLALYQNTKYIIGIEESSMDLIKKISCYDDYSSPKQLKILSIFGSMGLGKTTLAKLVYDKLKGEFSCGAFVSAGCKPDVTTILRDLLFELGGKSYLVDNTLDYIIVALQKLLAEKRYLIVVDDLWDISTWETIKCVLLDNDCGSLVIITTRNFQVGRKAGEVYKMKPLSHEKSEELFYNRLFGGKVNIPDQLVDVSKLITKKCGCIPLAIITMATLLVGKPRETWYALYNSIGFGHGDNEEVNNTRRISLFSYYDLPSRLRNCLLHLSLFPEGYMIWKDTLIWKWIAEGFIHKSEGVGLFEIGESYFYELINRSLVQPVEIPHSGGIIIGCRVNVIVLDMICFLSKQENFVMVLDSHERDTFDWIRAPLLAIQNRVVQENEMPTNPHVRSFNATKCELQMMPSLTRFQLLRVLALEDCASIGGIYHLEHIRKLVHLRYLGLFNTPICELPQDIGNLQYLQTLDLRQTKIEELPHAVVLLSELKCLRAGSRSITVPDGMGNLASLEELQLSDVISSSQNTVKELGKLKKLRDLKLCIRLSDERSKRDLVESLGNLQEIKILHLDGGLWIDESYWKGYVPSRHLRHVYLGMKFSRLPAWISPLLLPDLSHLSVDISVVEEEDLLILGSFPELLYLSLVGEHVCLPDTMGGDAFPRLKYCYTSGMVRFLKGAAPELESVSFNVRLWGLKDGSFDLKFRSLLDHPLLQVVRVEIFYTEAHLTEVDEVEAALSDVVHTHPNCPILDICNWKSSVSEQFGSHYDVDGNDYYDDNEEDNDHEYYYDEE